MAARMLEDDDEFYSPLLERSIPVDTVEVYRVKGFTKKEQGAAVVAEPLYDEDGQQVELLAIDGLEEVQQHINRPGRYRFIARDPVSKKILAQRDMLLRPQRGRRPLPEINPTLVGDSSVEKLLRKQVEAEQKTREKLETRCESLQADLRKLDVEREGYKEKAAAAIKRVDDLETRLSEAQTQLAEVQAVLTQAQKQLADADFSPLDAIGQLDGALDLIERTVDRFKA